MVNEKEIEGILNDLLKKDESAMMALLSLTVPTTKEVLEDYDVRFGSRSGDYPQLGIITIINKIIEKSNKIVNSNWVDNNKLAMISSSLNRGGAERQVVSCLEGLVKSKKFKKEVLGNIQRKCK